MKGLATCARLGVWLSVAGATATLPAAVLAASSPDPGGHGGGLRWISPVSPMFSDPPGSKVGLLWILVNFAVFLWILNRLLFRPLRARTAEKHETVRAQVEAARIAREEAETLMATFRSRMEKLDEEIETLLAQARQRAEADRARILAEAEAEAEAIRARARQAAERETQRAMAQLEAEILDRAIERAEAKLRAVITAGDEARLRRRFVSQLGSTSFGGRPS